MCPRGGELPTASALGGALIACAIASAAVPSTECPCGSVVGCDVTVTSVISDCRALARCLAVRLC